jgi:hypothetical protein
VSTTLEIKTSYIDRKNESEEVRVSALIYAGYTGREKQTVLAHIEELKKLGVEPPETVPTMAALPSYLISTSTTIEVTSASTSAEAEVALLLQKASLRVGIASDHTDRDLEGYDMQVSKLVCPKVVGSDFWAYDEVADHWDSLVLGSYLYSGAEKQLYQKAPLSALLPAEYWREKLKQFVALRGTVLLLTGTVPLLGGKVIYADKYELFLQDPVLERELTHTYNVFNCAADLNK